MKSVQCVEQIAYLVGQLCYQHKMEYTKTGDLLVDRLYTIEIGGNSKDGKQIASLEDAYIASDDIEYAAGNKIPLWAFGFLYWVPMDWTGSSVSRNFANSR